MAKRRATSVATSRDRTIDSHNLWLNYLKPVSLGLVVSPNALRTAQVELPLQSPEAQRALEAQTVARPLPDDAPDADREHPPRIIRDTRALLTGFLGWKPELLEFYRPGDRVLMVAEQGGSAEPGAPWAVGERVATPEPLRHDLAQYDDALEPSFAYRWPNPPEGSSPWCLVGLEVPADVDLDRKPAEADETVWGESPQKKFERLLYETEIPLGLIVHGPAVRIVYRPPAEQSGYITFPLAPLLTPAGRIACTALRELLKHDRLHKLPTRQRLHHILAESRKYQNEVSTQLAEQVLAALFALLKGFEAADADAHGRILRGLRDNPARTPEIYEGLLTVLMRLVFLLYAEEREMLPADPLFVNHYSLAGLFARLVEDEARHPDTMDQRYGAWAHLIALFRVIHDGVTYADPRGGGPVMVPVRRGDLFDPERFPFLEGRAEGEGPSDGPVKLPDVPDSTVLAVLRNLLYLGQERLSYRSLEVEQIGSVYEAIMGYQVETATGRSVAIRPEKRHGAPVTIDLGALLAVAAAKRVKTFRDLTDRKLAGAAATAVRDARTQDELFAALGRLVDVRLTPTPVPAGSLVFQPSPERRRTGSHYTPCSLTGPIVARAFEPILRRLGPEPTPGAILALKVCDPAMGSGAFLVEAMRRLARLLVAAWERHGGMPRIPRDETPFLFACRLVAQRCLYGVDKNKMAVDLAKLSLWLATLARDHAFTFLDHNLRHGDSLVGLSLAQVEACHWAPDVQQAFVSPSLRKRVAVALKKRQEILTADEFTSYAKLSDLRVEADKPLDFLRFLGDAVLGVFFEGGTASARERRRLDLSHTVRDYLNDTIDMPTRLVLRRDIEHPVSVLRSLKPPLEPFHWEIEFPEVFLGLEPDGSLMRRADGGFDAIVGNPPFAGGTMISTANGKSYLEFLFDQYEQSGNRMDLVAYFFRRAFNLVRSSGTFGLIATNTIAQGDTRKGGLRWICNHGGTIYAARKRLKWPGEAAVVVSVIHVHKGPLAGPFDLDGRPSRLITAYLFHAGTNDDPTKLRANANRSFTGSKIYGQGFLFDDTDAKKVATSIAEMQRLIADDPRNAERIFPYIGGKEVNDSPSLSYHRHVINFGEMTEDQARRWPGLMQIVEEKVKSERDRSSAEVRKCPWWLHFRSRPELYNAIREMDQVLACSLHQPYWLITFVDSKVVFSHALAVFAIRSSASIAILQSSPHELWARFFGSSLEDRLRYTPSDCFETFPFPDGWETNAALEAIGQDYYEYRAQLMRESNKGLTKTYNRFHDPKEKSPEVRRLRHLHGAMDRAVLAAYGWSDIDTTCGFDVDWCEDEAADDASPDTLERLETGRTFFDTAEDARAFATELVGLGKQLPWRYRWRPEVRDEVLARLLLLNKQRAEQERRAGLIPLSSDSLTDEDEDSLDLDDDADEETRDDDDD
jgi:hypothetical protein